MPYPTLTSVFDQARVILADQDVIGGDLYTDAKLLGSAQQATRDVWRALQNIQAPSIVRIRYLILRANTVSLDIASAVSAIATTLVDLKEPLAIYERRDLTEYTIASVAANTSVGLDITTTAAHGRATGDRVTINGLATAGAVQLGGDGLYGITLIDTDSFTANGLYMRISGTYGANTGKAVYSANAFQPMRKLGRLDRQLNSSSLEFWAWTEDRLMFRGADHDRQLCIVYESTASVPSSGSDIIPINDSVDVVATLAAAYSTSVRMPSVSQMLMNRALGPTLQRDGSAGMLRDLILPINNAAQLDRDKQRPSIEFVQESLGSSLG